MASRSKWGWAAITVALAVAVGMCAGLPARQAHALTVTETRQVYQAAEIDFQSANEQWRKNDVSTRKAAIEVQALRRDVERFKLKARAAVYEAFAGLAGSDASGSPSADSPLGGDENLNSAAQEGLAEGPMAASREGSLSDEGAAKSGILRNLSSQAEGALWRARAAVRQDELEKGRVARAAIQAKAELQIAEEAWAAVDHSMGFRLQQEQGTQVNCGAAAFTVGLNILLGEGRYDNVAVWSGPGFESNSTYNVAGKGYTWLQANGLADRVGIEAVPGDIFTAAALRDRLEQAQVVVASSGSGSVWRYSNGVVKPGAFPYGHYIVFYYYEDGIYYANDSSTDFWEGAGCPYTEDQVQQWLSGRSYHYATAMWLK